MNPAPRDFQLASILVDHSLKIKPKENVLISTSGLMNPLIKATYIEVLKRGAYPLLDGGITNFYINRASWSGLNYQFYKNANDWQKSVIPEAVLNSLVDWADAYVRITSIEDKRELADIDTNLLTDRMKLVRPIFDKMVDSDRWVLTYYPTESMAKEAGVDLDWLTEFYYQACIVDYKAMQKSLAKLEAIMDAGEVVEVIGKNTKLKLSIKGRQSKACFGERNIPDGEVFLAPIKESVEGSVYFDLPTLAHGKEVEGIYLEFEKGKVVKAVADKGQDALDKMLATDEGASYLGEFAIGANFNITRALKDTLFDEKIGGTIHMALGKSYKEQRGGAPTGGNESAIHWDLVKDMRLPGSEVKIDGRDALNLIPQIHPSAAAEN